MLAKYDPVLAKLRERGGRSRNDDATVYAGDFKVYFNGVDVTNSPDLPQIIASAKKKWYGSQGAYNQLVASGRMQPETAYFIPPQPDWNNNDPNSLGHILNQPQIMDMEYVEEEHMVRFFYRQ